MSGATIPFLLQPLQPTDKAFSVLTTAVIGSILQHYIPPLSEKTGHKTNKTKLKGSKLVFKPEDEFLKDLQGAFRKPEPTTANAAPEYAYEARVMRGIWAAAPYLHNGSVPTLVELLKPAAERVKEFKIGPAYDIENVGLAVQQTQFNFTLKTTDCSERNSGSSRCGHEFGTQLSADDKKALLEYLKTL